MTPVKQRTTTSASNAIGGLNLSAMKELGMGIYGGNGKPKYDLVANFGTAKVINAIKTAFGDFRTALGKLKVGEAAIMYSERFNTHNLAIKISDSELQYASLLWDKNGVVVAPSLNLVHLRANDDIEIEVEGRVVEIAKGTDVLKGVTDKYVAKLKKA
jgi:hypothetical protein